MADVRRAWLLLLACEGAASCEGAGEGGSEGETSATALRLVLAPDLSAPPDVAAAVGRVEIVLWTEGGFGDGGDFASMDLDGDGAGEAVAEVAMERRDALPEIVIEGEPDDARAVEILARGFDDDDALAAWGGAFAVLDPGREVAAEIPFELHEGLRAPRISAQPGDLPGCHASAWRVEFTAIAAGADPTLVYLGAGGGAETAIDPTGYETSAEQACDPFSGCRTVVTVAPGFSCACQAEGLWRIDFPDTLADEAGRPLSDTRTAPFAAGGAAPGSPACGEPFFECGSSCTSKAPIVCAEGLVGGGAGLCVDDCRVHDACPDPTQRCDAEAGGCGPR